MKYVRRPCYLHVENMYTHNYLYILSEFFKMKFLICVHGLIPIVPSPALNDKSPE